MADRPDLDRYPELQAAWDRRQFLKAAAVGTTFMAVGGSLVRIASAEQSAIAKEKRADGRPRLPPGQRTLEYLRPMGGDEGDPDPRKFSLKVFGNVKTPFSVDYAGLLKLPQVEKTADVHCVTGWSMLGGLWKGVQIAMLVAVQHQVAAHPAQQLVESAAIPQCPQDVEMLRQGRMMDEQQSKVIAGAIQHFFEPPKLPTT